jgi:hypothetical protein
LSTQFANAPVTGTNLVLKFEAVLQRLTDVNTITNVGISDGSVDFLSQTLQPHENFLQFTVDHGVIAYWSVLAKFREKERVLANALNGLRRISTIFNPLASEQTLTTRSANVNAL